MGTCQCKKKEKDIDEIISEKLNENLDNQDSKLKAKKPSEIPSQEFKEDNNIKNIEPVIEFNNQYSDNNNNNDHLEEDIDTNDLYPEDNFSKYIFENINKLRLNPSSYIDLIEDSKKNVTYDKKQRLVYKSKLKVALSKGIPVFDETIDILKQTQPMKKLIYNPKMNIPLPNTEEELKDKNYLKTKISELLNNGVKIRTFWRDIVKDPQTSFILMVVDDNGMKAGNKRRDLLNPNMKYMGITSTMIDKSFVCYLTFSDQI